MKFLSISSITDYLRTIPAILLANGACPLVSSRLGQISACLCNTLFTLKMCTSMKYSKLNQFVQALEKLVIQCLPLSLNVVLVWLYFQWWDDSIATTWSYSWWWKHYQSTCCEKFNDRTIREEFLLHEPWFAWWQQTQFGVNFGDWLGYQQRGEALQSFIPHPNCKQNALARKGCLNRLTHSWQKGLNVDFLKVACILARGLESWRFQKLEDFPKGGKSE